MTYLVVEYNAREPDSPLISVTRGTYSRRKALEIQKNSPNTCEVYVVGSDLVPRLAQPEQSPVMEEP